MSGRLKPGDKKQLEKWINSGPKKFDLLYSFTRDGSSASTFHQKCDNQGPTVTVIYNTEGYVYGGYTEQNWTSSSNGTYISDMKAFLFSLKTPSYQSPRQFVVKSGLHSYAIFYNGSYGPTFGGGNDLRTFTGTPSRQSSYYTLNGSYNMGHTYDMQSVSASAVIGNSMTVSDLEVYSVKDNTITFIEQTTGKTGDTWRSTVNWDHESYEELKAQVEDYRPPKHSKAQSLNILVLGPVGAGKSSFFNTISSVFRGHVTGQASSGSSEESITSSYRMYKIRGSSGKPLNFRLCDTMGLEESSGLTAHDVGYLLDGHVPDRYRFNPAASISPEVSGYREKPTFGDKIHCVCLVVDGTAVNVLSEKMVEKIKSIQRKIYQKEVPQVVLLTKVDKVCPAVDSDLTNVFMSDTIKDLVGSISQILGIPRGRVLPTKNYEFEIETTDAINTLALYNLRQMLRACEDFFYNFMDDVENTSETCP